MNLDKVFDFIKEKRGYNYPLKYKLINGMPLTDGDLNVGGNLDLFRSNIESLPDNLNVGGDLNISYNDINAIPDNLNVGGDFILVDTPLSEKNTEEEIYYMIRDKGGYIGGYIYCWW